jgi:amidohydrolase
VTLASLAELFPPPLRDALIALRHDLHRHPELALHETRTAERLEAAVRPVGAAPVVALRGDIDALPIQEETGVAFASTEPGIMHACGHDVHAAWAVGAGHLLARAPAAGDVLIVLQPAEEIGRGAPAILESGLLDEARAIVGGHVDMRFAVGEVVADPGPMAGSTDEFDIEIIGQGAHAARPHEARDPIVAAAAVVLALQTIVARRLPPGEPAVVTVGTLHAGTAENVIPERARLTGTLRAVHAGTRAALEREVRTTAEAVAEAHGVHARVTIHVGTPPIVNASGPVEWARAAVHHLLGKEALVSLPSPNLGGEDFAFYLERIPGCFLRFGARAPGGDVRAAHTSRFLPDDGAVLVGAAVLAETARRAAEAIG